MGTQTDRQQTDGRTKVVEYLLDEDPEEAEGAGEAAVGPLQEEEEEARGGAVGHAHLQARPIVVPRALGRPVADRQR